MVRQGHDTQPHAAARSGTGRRNSAPAPPAWNDGDGSRFVLAAKALCLVRISEVTDSPMQLRNPLRYWTDRLSLRLRAPESAHQAGAIPYALADGQVVFLLITSRRSGRWIFPKGAPIEGLAPWDVAAHEAFEEAGVEGEVDARPIGSYRTMKTLAIRRAVIEVDMYPLRVTRQLDDWPEKGRRHRHWAILAEAKRLLSNPKLADLAARLSQRVLAEAAARQAPQPTTSRITS